MRSTRAQNREKKALSYWDIYGLRLTEEGHQKGRQEGLQKGRQETTHQLIWNLLRDMPPKEVANRSGVPLNQVLKIKKQNSHHNKA